MVLQKEIQLRPYSRGYHIITDEVLSKVPEIKGYTGILQVFIKHTSASLTINENADPSVRTDFENHFNRVHPENAPYYEHTYEGADDMPAHLKTATLGTSVSIPINNGRPLLGTWQGIYLGEHRNRGGARSLVITFIGE
ncbi:secondary thiamine-phosphate synthase enzyme YjbQ [Flammeovirga kamogawensis]|uniref:Secondary thiamine-phosphate synthase enzyme YjbQ n=1 Tax=Flammeovirga kamogawensis TaxID=373891 RepID=A0ABX8GU59_9BACT|nr:secondary thiamine-phosphate synthase enzyme YjbQ [Flammeovirga kamogawensis]MBB6460008.1 secondary thiamine-phosphate synthase enzyme [Flammeovirga kamogawensis]QWG06944.1 secondary thiamine-phosphate synthase enzyme YjbQ [Flammeovirga kamogawensis]TRX68764.1 YjbQ family protein [Flammeovirga kamogawensis]